MKHELTTTPTALAGVTAGTRYSIQNQSLHVVHMQVAASAPTDPGNAFRLTPSGATSVGEFNAPSGTSCYVWVSRTLLGGGTVVYDEAP